MPRPSRHLKWMKHAEVEALMSTCFRRSVGAVLVTENRLISTGYNGPPSGHPHCTGKNCPGEMGCTRAVHAEINLFERMPRSVTYPKPLHLYVTESPCLSCALRIIEENVAAVYFMNEYRINDGLVRLMQAGIKVYRITPGDYLVDYKTNELVS